MIIESTADLRCLYGVARGRARDKQLDRFETHSENFVRHSPFVVIATYDRRGRLDVSPRGGATGFVQVLGPKVLVIPDAQGNNRIDSLVNIVETGRLGALFLIPGVDETLRVNGSARVTTDPDLLSRFSAGRNPPKTCIRMEVEEIFLHCAKALMRSQLWSAAAQIERNSFPSMGQMLKDQIGEEGAPETQEAMVARYETDL